MKLERNYDTFGIFHALLLTNFGQ